MQPAPVSRRRSGYWAVLESLDESAEESFFHAFLPALLVSVQAESLFIFDMPVLSSPAFMAEVSVGAPVSAGWGAE